MDAPQELLIESPADAIKALGFNHPDLLDSTSEQLFAQLETLEDKSLLYTYFSAEASEAGKKRNYEKFPVIQKFARICFASPEFSDDTSSPRLKALHFLLRLKKFIAANPDLKKISAKSTFKKSVAYFISQNFNVPNSGDLHAMCDSAINTYKERLGIKERQIFEQKTAERKKGIKYLTHNISRHVFGTSLDLYNAMIDGVYLGKHPTLKEFEEIMEQKPNIKLFIEVTEYNEANTSWIQMATAEDMQKKGLDFIIVNQFRDYSAPHIGDKVYTRTERIDLYTQIYFACRKMEIALAYEEEVFMNCKKGKGRSPQVLAIFRVAMRGENIEAIWQDMSENRDELDVIEKKGEKTKTYKAVRDCAKYFEENKKALELLFLKEYPLDVARWNKHLAKEGNNNNETGRTSPGLRRSSSEGSI